MSLLTLLAVEEQRLCIYVESLTGTLEDKNRQLENAGVFAAYKHLHRQYLTAYQAATSEPVRLELLKRLAFLNWYGALEPSFLTGISELDEDTVFTVYTLLDAHIRDRKLDEELRWMLSYYSCWDYLLLHYADNRLPALTAFIQAVDQHVLHIPRKQLPSGTMANRGQMGLYWESLGVERVP